MYRTWFLDTEEGAHSANGAVRAIFPPSERCTPFAARRAAVPFAPTEPVLPAPPVPNLASSPAPTTAPSRTTLAPTAIDLPGIRLMGGFRFRVGQAAFLEKLAEAFAKGETNHLGVFVPGYGKTITALASFVVARAMGIAEKLVVFVPRGNLRDQYADAEELSSLFIRLGAPPFSFCVADSETVFLKNLSTQIVITTYQYASGAGGTAALKRFCQTAPALFVFDEVHHLSDDGTWAQQIGQFEHAASIALSGTPMRSDNKTLFGVPFTVDAEGTAFYEALHEVTLRDAHAEGAILKRVEAHVTDYKLRLFHADSGQEVEMSLSEMEAIKAEHDVDVYLARRKMRFHDVYLEALLAPAFSHFAEKRAALDEWSRATTGGPPERQHQMLVIAMSNKHAAAMLAFVQQRFPGFTSGRIGQDVPARERARLLEDYREGRLDVMVQVDMIGEGTDIKPISVIVKADLVRATSKTLQQLFRGMRFYAPFGEAGNLCAVYAPDDAQVVRTLDWIASEEQIGATKRTERAAREGPPPEPPAPSERSAWELRDVEGRGLQTHSLHLAPSRSATSYGGVRDVKAEEEDLRRECADLASELVHVLRAAGTPASVQRIHATAMQRLRKTQDELSLRELRQKRRWLQRCLRARRLV